MGGLDRALFHWINHWPDSLSPFFWFLSEGLKDSAVKIALALLLIAIAIFSKRARPAVFLAIPAFLIANELTDVLKHVFAMPRPSVAETDAILRVGKLTSYGTASAHSANMAATATVFTAFTRWWGIPWILLAILVGISRIYVGVHYPSQVLFGWLCGIFAGFLIVAMYAAWRRLKEREGETVSG